MMSESSKTAKTRLKVLLRPLARLTYRTITRIKEIPYRIRYKNRYAEFRPSSSVILGVRDYESAAALLKNGDIESFSERLAELTERMPTGPLRGRALIIPE